MIEISVPQDIREFEPTLVGFLTTRQFLAGGAMIALVYGGYMLEKAAGIEDPLDVPLFLILAVPPFLIGWWKPFGMHFETFIVQAFRDNVQAPSNRTYVIENMWDTVLDAEKTPPTEEERRKQQEKPKQTSKKKLPRELHAYK